MTAVISQNRLNKQFFEAALCVAHKLKSEQTGFVHFSFEKPFDASYDTIPLYYNFLYALALLRSHQVVHMQEGMRILNHLLSFESEGLFPRYIHNYPFVHEHIDQIHILLTLVIIQRDHASLFSSELALKLKRVVSRLYDACLDMGLVDTLSELKMSLLSYAIKWIEHEEALFPLKTWNELRVDSTQQLSDLLIFSQLLVNTPMQKELKKIYALANQAYHKCTKSYKGPIHSELWDKKEPEWTLFHHVMHARAYQEISNRATPEMLLLALIEYIDEEPLGQEEKSFQFSYLPLTETYHNPHLALFNLAFKGDKDVFHLTCYAKEFMFSSKIEEDVYYGKFTLTKRFDPTDCKEAVFELFINHPEKCQMFVQGKPATTFLMNEDIIIQVPGQAISLMVHSSNDQSHFIGQLSRSNRPSQINASQFEAYDLKIAIRSVKYEPGDVLTLSMKLIGEHLVNAL